METNIAITSIKHYSAKSIRYWIFYFRKFDKFKGFSIRFFGVNVVVFDRESRDDTINKFVSHDG